MTTFALWTTLVVLVGVSGFLLGMLVHNIVRERRISGVRRIWKNFGLGLAFALLFLISWVAQGIAEWSTYAAQQRDHGQPVELSGFLLEFGQSTLENWQSEFLQLFSFVVLAAVLIHHGSAESKDGTDRIEKTVNEIRQLLRDQEAGRPAGSRSR